MKSPEDAPDFSCCGYGFGGKIRNENEAGKSVRG
jgi:hypothetical protein